MKKLIDLLRQYSESLVAYKLGADFADAVCSAADMLENHASDRAALVVEIEKLRKQLEQTQAELDAAVNELCCKSATLATNNDQYLFQPANMVLDDQGGQQITVRIAGVDFRNFTEYPELYPTLQAKPNGGQSLNFSGAVRVQYIVRRLTPTECARLQGFPDDWGHPEHKEDFTDEEYRFWLDVRNTHAAINGKPQKDYTKDKMLTWYNKLHTDSSEYKMWGNGISLPTALYVMQGIAEELKGGEGL